MARKINWRKRCDNEWGRVIREVGYCEMCGSKEGQLHAHHLIRRGNFAYRHLVENGACLCASCHTFASHSAHRDRTFFYQWLKRNRPGQWKWLMEHTVKKEKMIGKTKSIDYAPIKMKKEKTDEQEYYELKEIKC